MEQNRIQTTLKSLLDEAGVKIKEVRVDEFYSPKPMGITRTNMELYCSEGIVHVQYRQDPGYDFLQYPDSFQDVCLRHEVCEVVVNGCHWNTYRTYKSAKDYFTLAFIEFLIHMEFKSRYSKHIPTYCSKWDFEMKKYRQKLNIKDIESDICKATYNFIALLIFISE